MPHIFGHDPLRIINPFKSKYCDKAKEDILKLYFGDRTMMDLNKTCAVISFKFDGKKSLTHSFFNKEGNGFIPIICVLIYLFIYLFIYTYFVF